MKTIGELIKKARLKKRYSLKAVEKETKIKSEFIKAIEDGNWIDLPDLPIVSGFVKTLSSYLSLNEKGTLAVLRRDYPPKDISINPKPDVDSKFVWSPRLTFVTIVSFVILAVAAYLGFTYLHFVSPPSLSVYQPNEGQVVNQRNLLVSGKVDTDATVLVNNQQAIVDSDGNFATTIEVSEKTTEVDVVAKSRSGRETVVKRNIKPELK